MYNDRPLPMVAHAPAIGYTSPISAAMPGLLSGGLAGGLLAGAGMLLNHNFKPSALPANARTAFLPGHGLMGLGALAVTGGALAGAAAGVSQMQLNSAYKDMLQRYPELAREEPTRVRELFVSISRAAPDVAKDHIVAGSLIKRMLNYDGVDHTTYMELVRTQESMAKTRMAPIMPMVQAVDVGSKLVTPLL